MEKSIIYIISSDKIERAFLDNVAVQKILAERVGVRIIRTVTNQIAMLVCGEVVWVDIKDEK